MRAVLVNATFMLGHHGCTLVDRQLDALAAEAGIAITAKLPLYADWEALAPPDFDAILVNGEGALHHDSKAARRLCEVPHWARARGRPAHLINSVYQENSAAIAAGIRLYDTVFVRDEFSRGALADAGITASVVPDLTLTWTPSAVCGTGRRIAVTDSTLRCSNARLHRLAHALGARFLPLRARPQRASFVRRSRFALKRLAGHLAPPGLWRDRWHGLIPDFDDWIAWVAENAGLIVAGRFHGLCMALAMRIPAVALASNTWKVEGILERAGLRHRLVADVDGLERRLMAEGIAAFAYNASELAAIAALQREARSGARAMLRAILARSRVAAAG
jgi:hypothetical protein